MPPLQSEPPPARSCLPAPRDCDHRQPEACLVNNIVARYYRAALLVMIMSFGDPDVQAFFKGERIRRWINIERTLMRKLAVLDDTRRLEDLRDPPSNRLKSLQGDRSGQYSIRINDQFRICFVWIHGNAHHVTVVDYH